MEIHTLIKKQIMIVMIKTIYFMLTLCHHVPPFVQTLIDSILMQILWDDPTLDK